MIFKSKSPIFADVVRVGFGSLYHYGIFVSNDEVIQFGLHPYLRSEEASAGVKVVSTDVGRFLCGGALEVAEYTAEESEKKKSPTEIVSEARRRIGEGGYHILYNNCEHFVFECVMGEHYCSQTDRVREYFRSLPIVDIYVYSSPGEGEMTELSHPQRQKELELVNNPTLRREKYYAWKLLEYGLYHSFGLSVEAAGVEKCPSGKWVGKRVELSISHSEGAVAVAISRAPIGVDIEPCGRRFRDGFAERMLTEREMRQFLECPPLERDAFLGKTWCKKEAIFKSQNKDSFSARAIETVSDLAVAEQISVGGREYFIAISTQTPEKIRYITVDKMV